MTQKGLTMEDVSKDIVQWAAQLRDALKLRNSVQHRLNKYADGLVDIARLLREEPEQVHFDGGRLGYSLSADSQLGDLKPLLDDIRRVNSQIGELVKLLKGADAEYIASALVGRLG